MINLALVTGATSGLGMAMARKLFEANIPLIITGRNVEILESLEKELQCEAIACDLADAEDRERLLRQIDARCPDLVFNNAGFGLYGDAVDLDLNQQRNMVRLNIEAMQEIALTAARALKKNNREGTILNVSSAAYYFPGPGFSVYAATKAFVTSFSQGLAHELAPYGISVLVSCPGVVSTDFSFRAAGGLIRKTPALLTMSTDHAINQMWRQIQGKKWVDVVDFRYKFLIWLGALLPQRLVRKLLYGTIKAKIES